MKVYSQKADHACGAACVRMILDHFSKKVLSERTLLKKLRATFKRGIEPQFIEMYLQQQGLTVEYRDHETVRHLWRRLCAGWIPIICWSDWGGHYCIVAQMQFGSRIENLTLYDPAAIYEGREDGLTQTSLDRFKSMWHCAKKKGEVIYVRGD
jgi:ABC-type bacteriocin/lantibiotic exporter with double-glycine peptidase domain